MSGDSEAVAHELMSVENRDFDHDFAFIDRSFAEEINILGFPKQNSHAVLTATLGASEQPWAAVLEPGVLTVTGDNRSNDLRVVENGSSSWTVDFDTDRDPLYLNPDIDPSIADVDSLNPFDSPISRIAVQGLGDDDLIDVDEAISAMLDANGGEGDDTIYGGAGNDMIDGGPGSDFLDGRDGSDAYVASFEGIGTSLTTVSDSGGVGIDSLTVNGTPADDILVETPTQVTFGAPVTEIVNYAGIEDLTVNGHGGQDIIIVNGSQTTILGGPGNDTFIVNATGLEPLLLDGQDGPDTYTINLGHLDGIVTIADSGLSEFDTDTVIINGTELDDTIVLREGEIQLEDQTVHFDLTIENITIDGGAGNNYIIVEGNLTTLVTWQNAAGAGVTAGTLLIVGTAGDDHVTVNRQGNGFIKVHANFFADAERGNFKTFVDSEIDLIHIVLGDGDDHATITANIDTTVIIDSRAGDDHLNGGNGSNILLGGSGNDVLLGGSDFDLLIGGLGADLLNGNSGDDILIGGFTAFDSDVVSLLAILVQWNHGSDYASRIATLEDEDKPFFLKKGVTVFDDEAIDTLFGSAGLDWFFWELDQDRLRDRQRNEIVR